MVKKQYTCQLFLNFISPMNYFSCFFLFVVQLTEEMLTSRSKSLSGVSVPFSDITDGLLLVIIINIVVWDRARVGAISGGEGGRLRESLRLEC